MSIDNALDSAGPNPTEVAPNEVPPCLFPRREDLPDHASEQDHRALAIDKVGIKDLSYPIQVMNRDGSLQHTVARVSLYVSLPHQFKGTHMSRFVEILNARRGEITVRNISEILAEMQNRLGANDAHIELSFPYFINKRAPKSGVESLMEYPCAFVASIHGATTQFTLHVRVPVKSLCPCSKAISERGAHNQRSLVDVAIRSENLVWIEEVVDVVESCASAPLFALLKREDEKYVTELAYDNPKFVEDLVRDVVLKLRDLPGVQQMSVSAENHESIHNHSAFGQIEWSADQQTGEQQTLRFPSGVPPREPSTFGAWLREQRLARNISQQEFAERLQMSAAHLSRVELGEKGLSEDSLSRVAEVLGLGAEEVAIRAGTIPASLLAWLSQNPQRLLAWAHAQRTQTD